MNTLAAMPAHNENERIAKVVLGAKKHVDKVVVVDDGRTDSTAEIAEALGALVVRHEDSASQHRSTHSAVPLRKLLRLLQLRRCG